MKNPCFRHKCIRCCLETEMLLSNRDIERITESGFEDSHFAVEDDGYLRLRNYRGRCVFHDGYKCMIYENRPEGCRLYPLIYDDDTDTVRKDDDCPYARDFKISSACRRKVVSLVKRLDSERRRRA
jgi:Fe-S-cluster containining protein